MKHQNERRKKSIVSLQYNIYPIQFQSLEKATTFSFIWFVLIFEILQKEHNV